MVKEDILLGLEMGRLEIEPLKPNKKRDLDNDLEHSLILRNNHNHKKSFPTKCCCPSLKKQNSIAICKRKSNKIIREPVLRILKCENGKIPSGCDNQQQSQYNKLLNSDTLSLCTLVQNCNQLRISSGSSEIIVSEKNLGNETKWWRNDISASVDNKESRQSNKTSSCSQQALNPPCDVTIDELASYFETLVHIPKKMSSMAEMMYI